MIYPFLYKKLIFPAYHIVKKDNLLYCVKELKENQWKSFEEIKEIQKVKAK